ncbi:hypothetical protein NSP_17190 [Nodularia spumigena CCY9414]|jgi:hypothetical protein|nr:hypothetical protein NSP_17190 [Nodularia spumigena CCY9414]
MPNDQTLNQLQLLPKSTLNIYIYILRTYATIAKNLDLSNRLRAAYAPRALVARAQRCPQGL